MASIYKFSGLSIMSRIKDLLDNPDTQARIDNYLEAIARDYPNANMIDVTVPMNTQAEALAARGSQFAIDPAVYASRFNNKIHALGKSVYWRATDCYFEGIYSFSKPSRRNGNRYTFFGTPIYDNFTGIRDHGYGLTSASGNVTTNWNYTSEGGNTWTISNGVLTGPAASGWRRAILFDATYLRDCTVVCKVKKIGSQQIINRGTADASNFPGYGLQMRTGELRTLRTDLTNTTNNTNAAVQWINNVIQNTQNAQNAQQAQQAPEPQATTTKR